MHALAFVLLLFAAACGSGAPANGSAQEQPQSGAPEDSGMAHSGNAGSHPVGPPSPNPPTDPFVYVGSASGRIFIFSLDEAAGTLAPRGSVEAGKTPSFLAFHPTLPFVYAVDEKAPGTVSAFALNESTGGLTFLNAASSGGDGPAHLFVDRSGQVVLAANYASGTVAVLPLQSSGGVSESSDTRSPGANAHQIVTDRSNRWALVPCLGDDVVAQFALDTSTGTLVPSARPALTTPAGASPRHLDFRPDNRFAYLLNEKNSTVLACSFDPNTGGLTALQTVSTLPAGFTGENTAAEVLVHPNGRFLYASNRGDDSIATFAVDPQNGRLTLLGHQKTGGQKPRSFALNAEGTFLICANETSGTLTGFRVDPRTGRLTPVGELAMVPGPQFVGVRGRP